MKPFTSGCRGKVYLIAMQYWWSTTMNSSNHTSQEHTASERRHVAITMVIQFAALIVVSWAVAFYVNWSSAAAMSEFVAATTPHASAAGAPHASIPLQPAHHRTAICPRST